MLSEYWMMSADERRKVDAKLALVKQGRGSRLYRVEGTAQGCESDTLFTYSTYETGMDEESAIQAAERNFYEIHHEVEENMRFDLSATRVL